MSRRLTAPFLLRVAVRIVAGLGLPAGLAGEAFAAPVLNASPSPPAVTVPASGEDKATVSVFNSGDMAATNVKITFTLPAGLTFQPVPTALVDEGDGNYSFTVASLGSFNGIGASIGFRAESLGDYTVNYTVTADHATTVNGSFDVSVVKSPQDASIDGVGVDAGDPVGSFRGNFRFPENVALRLAGPSGIGLMAHYDSGMAADGVVQSALGPGWQHNYELRLTVAGSDAVIAFSGGRVLKFKLNAGVWEQTFRTDVGFRLVASAGEFILGDPRSQVMYFFNGGGRLVRIEDGRGNTTTLTYSGADLATVSDGLGRTLTFTHTGGLLTSVTDGARTVGFGYTGGTLTSFTNADGKVTLYAYDGATARMTSRTLPEGNTPVTQVYDASGRVTSQTDAAAGVMTLSYAQDFGGFSTTITDPSGATATHGYTNFGELSSLTDEAEKMISLGVDDAGRRNGAFDRTGQFTNIFYDADTGMPDFIQHPGGGLNESFTYTPRTVNGIPFEDLTRHDLPDFTADQYAYDASGNLTQWTLRDGEIFTFTHNARGQVLTATNPTAGVATYTYDANARLATAADTDVAAHTYGYDALHRLTLVTNPDTTTRAFAYDVLNRVTGTTNERGHTTSLSYDDNSRLTSVTDALTNAVQYEYDALDRVTRIVDRLGEDVSFTYDIRQLPATVTDRNNFTTTFTHDTRRRMTGVTNAAGKTTSFGYDDEGRLTSITNPRGETTTIGRDEMGYPVSATDANGHTATRQLDAMKRTRFAFNQLGNKTSYSYTARGQLASVTLPNGIAASYRYNDLGALGQITDPNGREWNFTHTPMGRTATSTDPLGRTTSFSYDNRGRRTLVTFPGGATLTPTYDGAGNVTRLLYSDGTDLNYTYDALHRVTSATDGAATLAFTYDAEGRVTNTRQPGPLDFSADYDAGGRLTSVTHPGGTTVSYTYDSRDRLTSAGDSLTGTTLTFSYDDADRLTGIARPNGVNTIYDYDAAGRLVRIREGTIIDIGYTLDAAGRITEADFVNVPLDPTTVIADENVSFTYDDASQISTGGHSYDTRGRQTASPANTYTWDDASRLVAINAVTNDYNALGDIVTRTEAGATTRFFYNAALALRPIVAERNETTMQLERLHVWSPGGLLLYIINLPGNTVSFPHFDQVGSTLALTNVAGAVTDSYGYDLHGRLLAQTGTSTQPWRFNGRFGVRTDGPLRHMRARWYDSQTARFLSKEPIWPLLRDPRKLNPYQYAQLDPVRRIDRRGTDDELPQVLEGAGLDSYMRMFLEWGAGASARKKEGGSLGLEGYAAYWIALRDIKAQEKADAARESQRVGEFLQQSLPPDPGVTGEYLLNNPPGFDESQDYDTGGSVPPPAAALDMFKVWPDITEYGIVGGANAAAPAPTPPVVNPPAAATPPMTMPAPDAAAHPGTSLQTTAPMTLGGAGTSAGALLFSPGKGVVYQQSAGGGTWRTRLGPGSARWEPLGSPNSPFGSCEPSGGDTFPIWYRDNLK